MSGDPPANILTRANGTSIAYHLTAGRTPTVVFLPGFRSDMQGGKALALEAWCREHGRAYLRFDYSGHGESSGAFEDGTIGAWSDDAIDAVGQLTAGPVVLVGSSMGGWVMLLTALALGGRVAGMVGIAPAPDFTEELIWKRATPEQKRAIEEEGVWYEPSEYSEEPTPFTARLIEDGRNHLLLGQPIPLTCPTRLIHGMRDPDVPWQHSLTIAQQLAAADVELHFIKDGDHRLSEPHDLERLCRVVGEVCALAGS